MTPTIIIFGAAVRPDGSPCGAMRSRVDAALATARDLASASFMPTGGQGRYGSTEAEVMSALLVQAGVDRSRIRLEPTGRNTMRSALACRRLLGPTTAPVYVATSAYHMPRCLLLLRLAGLRAKPGRLQGTTASRDVAKRWFWRMREVPALPVDALLLLFWRVSGRI